MDTHATRRSLLRRMVGSAALALTLTAIVVAVVSAHDGGGPGGGPGGGGPGGGATISAINGTQLTLTTADGWTRTLDAAGATVMNGTTTITIADLEVGDEIAVQQSRNFNGTTAVVEIDVVAPHVEGTVTTVDATSLTIQAADGTSRTVTLTTTTTYNADRGAAGTAADVTVGSVARVQGSANADGSFTATSISVHPATLGGTVTAVGADSITVSDASGATATINVTSTTTYRTATGAGTLASVVVGSVVRAEGLRSADGSLTATAVNIGTADDGFGRGFGGGHGGRGGPGGPRDGIGNGAAPGAPSASPSAAPSASPSA